MFSANSSQVLDDKLFVEDVFSTYLYTGSSSAQTITNGIDLAGKGGLVWMKRRDAAVGHYLFDTNRGGIVSLDTSSTSTGTNWGDYGLTYNSNGFTILSGFSTSATFASWTFREAPKFFDVVTYTGNGASSQTISHNLGSAPGFVIVKRTDSTSDWFCWHRDLETPIGVNYNIFLNTTGARNGNSAVHGIGNPVPTSTQFTVRALGNENGATYVAYLFAHDTSSTGIIQCGSYTGNGYAGAVPNTITLGWEPQWVMIKKSSSASTPSDWFMFDNMRGMPVASAQTQFLSANTTGSEIADTTTIQPTSTGFQLVRNYSGTNANGETYIYIAIRRGPMRTPTSGTSVFSPLLRSGTGSTVSTSGVGFPPDLFLPADRNQADVGPEMIDRLRGIPYLVTSGTAPEYSNQPQWTIASFGMDGVNTIGASLNSSGYTFVDYYFRRAPSFFDVVCYTGTGSAQTLNHNLGVAPELMIVKARTTPSAGSANWLTYQSSLGASAWVALNLTNAVTTGDSGAWNNTAPTSTGFTVGTYSDVNRSTTSYVAYLFASCPGVSKVGSYTGNGSSQTINCGFAAGARFVLIKRTDSTGDWYVWDTARGIVSGNDPHLSLNSTAAEVTSDDSVDTDSSGFVVNQLSATNINVSSATYIYLAVA